MTADQIRRRARIIAVTCLSLLGLTRVNAQSSLSPVERYGYSPSTRVVTFGPPPYSRVIQGRIGEQGTKTNAFEAFTTAQEFEALKNPIMALESYRNAIESLRREFPHHDPKFIRNVVTKYTNLLRKQKLYNEAKSIKKEFADRM